MNITLIFILIFYTICIYFLSIYISCYSYLEYFLHLFESDIENVYDYIIVGCGTAGSLIAHQLSAHKKVTFLVLEAGGNGGPLLDPPALGPLLQNTLHDWQHQTIPQKDTCLAMTGKKSNWPMGKIIGGSARLNNMVHIRGYTDEMSLWFNKTHNITRMDQYLRDLEEFDLPYEKLKFKTRLSHAILEAALESGYNVNEHNDDTKTGFMDTLVNQKNGARWSTAHTLMDSHFDTPDKKILTNAFVEKIVIDPTTKVASHVIFERFGKKSTVTAKKGIILTSGAIGTPKLLLLSGVGPKQHLEDVGIPVIKDLPVGENLIDHVTTGLDLVLLNSSINFGISDFLNPVNAWNYFVHGDGSWTTSGCEAVAILRSGENTVFNETAKYLNGLPDLQLMVLPVGISTDHGAHLKKSIGITDHVWDSYFSKVRFNNSISILPIVLHPRSKGTVRLSGADPSDKILIDPRYFSDCNDVDVILRGIDLIKRLLKTQAMIDLGASLNTIPFPGCENLSFDTKDYWMCYVRHLTLTTYHPAGTCRMGSPYDESSVVDYDFRVMGLTNLFVADASLFPTFPSGNINTAVALTAKIFSDKILKLK